MTIDSNFLPGMNFADTRRPTLPRPLSSWRLGLNTRSNWPTSLANEEFTPLNLLVTIFCLSKTNRGSNKCFRGKYAFNCLGKLYRRANSTGGLHITSHFNGYLLYLNSAVRVARRSYKTYRCWEGSSSGAKITQIGHLDVAKILAPTLVTSNLSSYCRDMSFRPEDLPEGAINTKEIDGLWKYFASVSVDDIEGGSCSLPLSSSWTGVSIGFKV